MRKIGQKNKTFNSFLMNEEEFLHRKFEMATLVIPRSYKIDGKFPFATEKCFDSAKILEDTYRVSVTFLSFFQEDTFKDISRISIIGFLEDVMNAARKVEMWVQKDGPSGYGMFHHMNDKILSTLRKKVRQIEADSKKKTNDSSEI